MTQASVLSLPMQRNKATTLPRRNLVISNDDLQVKTISSTEIMTCPYASMSKAVWATLRVCRTTLLAKFMYVPRCVLETLRSMCPLPLPPPSPIHAQQI